MVDASLSYKEKAALSSEMHRLACGQKRSLFFGLQNARGIARGAMVFVSLCASMRTALARGA